MSDSGSKDAKPLQGHMLRGSVWTVGVRWTIRMTGVVSTVVLARLLTPSDYGVVAIAMIIATAIEAFAQTGQHLALIRLPAPTHAHYDAAWTMQVLIGFALGAVVSLSAPFATLYFHEPRATLVLHIVAFRTILSGFENIGVVNFRKNLRFDKQFWYNVVPTFASFVVALTSAFVLRNYWALVAGIMTRQIVSLVLSYIMEPFRPRFSFEKVSEIWSFSIWTLIRSIGANFNSSLDKFAIGGFAGAAAMGRYEVASDVAVSPSAEVNAPMITVLFPVMATIQHDPAKRRELYLRVLYWSALICTSTSIGVAVVSSDMVDLVLGQKWHDVKPLMPWLALAFGILGLSDSVYPTFDILGRPDYSARLQWSRFAALLVCVFPVAYLLHSLRAVAITRFVVTCLITPTLFATLARSLDIRFREFVATLWRPIAAGLSMGGALSILNFVLPFSGPPRLGIDIVCGVAIYTGVLMLTWITSGRPDGPETHFYEYVRKALNRPDPHDKDTARVAEEPAPRSAGG
jgi:O-antigen/teichoic acid export membrane protein